MLLTYHDTAHIPNKLSIFYNQAYESLFQKHDALKGGYQRERRTSLDIQDFARVFAAFCVRTYSRRQFTFPVTQALAELERCREIARVEFVAADFLADAQQSVCLLIEEGTDLGFAHRSFQEYFTAVYIASAPPHTKAQLIARFVASVGTDEVLHLLYEIDPYAVEQHFVLPQIQRLRAKIGVKRKLGMAHYKKYVRSVFETIQLIGDKSAGWGVTINDRTLLQAVLFVDRHYVRKGREGATAGDDESSPDSLGRLLSERFAPKEPVPMRVVLSNPEYLQVMKRSPSILGFDYLHRVLDVEGKVRKQHIMAQGSLDAILE